MKSICMFFPFLACLFCPVWNVHTSSPSYDVSYYGGTLTLDTWDDATYEEELVTIISKDSYRDDMLALETAMPTRLKWMP